jgi:hypothetical protein
VQRGRHVHAKVREVGAQWNVKIAATLVLAMFNKKQEEQSMRRNVLILAAAALVAGTVATAAQQLPQEPRGEESSRSATPRGELSGPDQTRGQAPRGPNAAAPKQPTPQEPRGEESAQSANPKGQQPPPNPGQPGR